MLKKYLKKIRNKLKKHKSIKVGDYLLKANIEHKLDIYLSMHKEYSTNFSRIAAEVIKSNDKDETIIDIGANIGDTVALLRTYGIQSDIYCIEGDESYFSLLKANSLLFKNVVLLKCYLTDTLTQKGYVVEKGMGSARVVESVEKMAQSNFTTLDELALNNDFGKIGIIKIDTDGFDTKIIRGAIKTIERHKPVLFFEYDCDLSRLQNEKPADIVPLLAEKGYERIIYFDNYGRLLLATSLENTAELQLLDRYIQQGKGAFPYYDVFIFPKEQKMLYEKIVSLEFSLK